MKELLKKEEWLAVCRKLLAYYKNELPVKVDYELQRQCPFCTLATEVVRELFEQGKLVKAGEACKFCVWSYFEGETCSDYAEKKLPCYTANSNIEAMRRYRSLEWVQMRIPMLEKWIAKLEKESDING